MKEKKKNFRFIDLFAGIGGFHLAMHSVGGKCVFASEWDKFARITYESNYKKISPEMFEKGNFNWDINLADPKKVPDFEILCAGFPCQPLFTRRLKKRL
ncbi:MAG: DNA cytosine methyltransferase [Ferruginibacter sp.]